MSEAAGEAQPPAERRSLRAAFGLSGGAATPPAGDADPATALLALARAAHRVFRPGQPLAEEELAAQVALLARAAPGMGLEPLAERLLQAMLPSAAIPLEPLPATRPALPATNAAPIADRALFGDIVNACYMALLARPAGEVTDAWWAEFQPMFQQQGVEPFLIHFIALLMASEEFATLVRRAQDSVMRGALVPSSRGVGGVASFISLGSDGFTANLLKRFDRKRWSGPFDWMSATPAMIRAMISEDFATLLDPAAYAVIPIEERPDARFWRSRNLRYEERFGHPCILHAADMSDLGQQYYMVRCVERFRTHLRGLSSKLVLQVTPEGPDPGRDFIQTADLLDSYGRNVTFVMVSLLPDQAEGPFPEVEPALRHGPHRLLRMRLLAPIDNAQALDMLDEVVLLRAVLAAPGLSG